MEPEETPEGKWPRRPKKRNYLIVCSGGSNAPSLLTTLYPSGDPVEEIYDHAIGTVTYSDAVDYELQDNDDESYAWLKSVTTGSGTATIRVVLWPFTTCPNYTNITHVIIRMRVLMSKTGTCSKAFLGAAAKVGTGFWDSDVPAAHTYWDLNTVPADDFVWQEFTFRRANTGTSSSPVWTEWTTALINGGTYGWDLDQFVSGAPGNLLEFQISELQMQVWGTG